MPTHAQVHADRPLSNFAVEYRNDKLIADMCSPFVPVNNKSDSYYIYTKRDRFTLPETIRGPKAEANEVDWSTSTSSYGCIDHALREFLPDALVANSDPGVDPRRRTTGFLTDLLLLAYERVIASKVTTASNYASAYKTALTGADRWNQGATSDPIANVDTAKAACFLDPNTMIMGKEVWNQLKRHPAILDHIKGGATTDRPSLVTLELVAEIFELDRVLVGSAKYNSANKGATASYSYVWGKDCVLAYIDQGASLEGVSAWKTFRWRQLSTDAVYQVRTYRDESKGGGGEYIETETSYDEVAVCSDVAYLIDTVID
jgi:hypothetical protein